jgi:hypothetical protein
MRLHWLLGLLVVGLFLVGCSQERPTPPTVTAPATPTPQKALEVADKTMADMEKALAGTDKDAMMKAAQQLDLAVSGLRGQLGTRDDAAAQKAHTDGKEAPPATAGQLGPAMTAAGSMMSAVSANPPDVARAKALLTQVKSGVDAVRKIVQ